jgi:hypothetical protein
MECYDTLPIPALLHTLNTTQWLQLAKEGYKHMQKIVKVAEGKRKPCTGVGLRDVSVQPSGACERNQQK